MEFGKLTVFTMYFLAHSYLPSLRLNINRLERETQHDLAFRGRENTWSRHVRSLLHIYSRVQRTWQSFQLRNSCKYAVKYRRWSILHTHHHLPRCISDSSSREILDSKGEDTKSLSIFVVACPAVVSSAYLSELMNDVSDMHLQISYSVLSCCIFPYWSKFVVLPEREERTEHHEWMRGSCGKRRQGMSPRERAVIEDRRVIRNGNLRE